MKTLLTFAMTSLIAFISFSQEAHSSCDGSRYVDDVFENINKSTGILYGNNTTINGANKDLFLDVYEPEGDIEEYRPTIVFAFGGSFIGGDRGDVEWICERYAKKGFVAVAIDYRLYDKPFLGLPTSEDMTDVAVKATSDMKAAIRFLTHDVSLTNTYGIDTNYIYAAGISSGAIMANHVGYLDSTDVLSTDFSEIIHNNGGFEGNSNNLTNTSAVKAVISFSGALIDSNFINTGDVPLFSVHEDGDKVVPFGDGFATILNVPIVALHGSSSSANRADFVNVTNELIVIQNSDEHVGYFFGNSAITYEDSVVNTSAKFLENITCPITVGITNKQDSNIQIYPNPSSGLINFSANSLNASSIKVLDIKGEVLKTINPKETQITLNPGIYFIEVNTNVTISRQKVIIN